MKWEAKFFLARRVLTFRLSALLWGSPPLPPQLTDAQVGSMVQCWLRRHGMAWIRREEASRRKQEESYNCLESLTSNWIRIRIRRIRRIKIRIEKDMDKDKERGGEQTETGSILQLLGELDLYLDTDKKDKGKDKEDYG